MLPIKRLQEREKSTEYLLAKKRRETLSSLQNHGLHSSAIDSKVKEILETYRSELDSLILPAFEAVYLIERENVRREEPENLDAYHFFHQPNAAADFAHWSKAAYWTLEEAVALCLGKEPSIVNFASLTPYLDESPFAQRFAKAADLANRALQAKLFEKPVRPGEFLDWAIKSDLPVPKELIMLIQDQGRPSDLGGDQDDALSISGADHKVRRDRLETMSPYWRSLARKTRRAIDEYPRWRRGEKGVQKTGNLRDWLRDTIDADSREAEIIKKVLSEIHKISL